MITYNNLNKYNTVIYTSIKKNFKFLSVSGQQLRCLQE